MGEAYGPYPALNRFPHQDDGPHPSNYSHDYSAAQPGTHHPKSRRHAACDECRKRKLKCGGEFVGCSRCVKNGIRCNYSEQKQMGRPRKRQKIDGGDHSPTVDEFRDLQQAPSMSQVQSHYIPHVQAQPQPDPPIDPSLANIDQDLTDFQNVCTGPMAQTIRIQREAEAHRATVAAVATKTSEPNGGTSVNYTHGQYPTDISLWPDFSSVDKLPIPLTSKFNPDPIYDSHWTGSSTSLVAAADTTQPYSDPDIDASALAQLPSVPSCPCLPNLYLSLSTLSTLTSFPISQSTIDTLLTAHKTAHAVIYCSICPQQFQSGSQNLMLGCTLLNVLSDQWHRIRNAEPEVFRRGFAVNSPDLKTQANQANNNSQFPTVKEGIAWRKFRHQIIRAYVFGDAHIPAVPKSSSSSSTRSTAVEDRTGPKVLESNTLTFIISALERRQRQWHRLDTPTDEFADRLPYNYYKAQLRSHNHGRNQNRDQDNIDRPSTGGTQTQTQPTHNADSNGDDHATISTPKLNGNPRYPNDNDNDREHNHERHDHDTADTLLCLMIVGHSKSIMQALDKDPDSHIT